MSYNKSQKKMMESKTNSDSFSSSRLLLSLLSLLCLFVLFFASASAADFIIANSSNPAQNYFVVNGSSGQIGIDTLNMTATVTVNGSVKMNLFSTACTAALVGAVRYNSTIQTLEFCNSTNWNRLVLSSRMTYNITVNVTNSTNTTTLVNITYSATERYNYQGAAVYVYRVNVSSNVTIKAWGAGGYSNGGAGSSGGGGGFAQGTFIGLVAGDNITVFVPPAGAGGGWAPTYAKINRGATVIGWVVAGSGGDGAGDGGCTAGSGGVGGGSTGGDGTTYDGGTATGGTSSSGGSGGYGGQGADSGGSGSGPLSSTILTVPYQPNGGGSGGNDGSGADGARGGSGWYGGGGGGGGNDDDETGDKCGNGGGGGSGFVFNATSTTNNQGSGSSVANSGDTNYQAGIGNQDQAGQLYLSITGVGQQNVSNTTNTTTQLNVTLAAGYVLFPDGSIQYSAANVSTSLGSQWVGMGPNLYYTNGTVGEVGINTTNPSYALHVVGAIGATSFSYFSDSQLKKNIHPLDVSLMSQKVLALNPVSFEWKNSSMGTGPQIGFIAQDVEEIFPQAVNTANDGTKSVAYDTLIAPLIATLQEQQKELKELEEEYNQLVSN